MDEKTKLHIDEINRLIEEISSSDEDISQEVLDLIDNLSSEVALLKAQKEAKNHSEFQEKFTQLLELVSQNKNLTEETAQNLVEAIRNINIEPPMVNVEVPPIEIPEIKPPDVHVASPDVIFPDEMRVKEPGWLSKIIDLKPLFKVLEDIRESLKGIQWPRSAKEPIPVRLSDGEKFYMARGGGGGGTGGGSILPFQTDSGVESTARVDRDGHPQVDIRPFAMKITVSGSVTYVGLAKAGTPQSLGQWQCRKIDETTGTVVTWADGNTKFDNVATDLTVLEYS